MDEDREAFDRGGLGLVSRILIRGGFRIGRHDARERGVACSVGDVFPDAFDCVGEGVRDLVLLLLELGEVHDPGLEDGRDGLGPGPEHLADREQRVFGESEGESHCLQELHAAVAVALPVHVVAHGRERRGEEEAEVAVAVEPAEDRGDLLRAAEQLVEEVMAPFAAPVHREGFFRVEVADEIVLVDLVGAGLEERRDVAADVPCDGDMVLIAARWRIDAQEIGDLGAFSAGIGRDLEVERERDLLEVVQDLVQQVEVVDVEMDQDLARLLHDAVGGGEDLVFGERREIAQGARGGVDAGVAVAFVRLQIGALGPFVPRVDEDETFLLDEFLARVLDDVLQPVVVGLEREILPHGVPGLAAAGIVPAEHGAAVEGVGGEVGERAVFPEVVDDLLVVVIVAVVLVGLERGGRVHLERGDHVGRELDFAVDLDELLELVALDERAAGPDLDLADAVVAAPQAPRRERLVRVRQDLRVVDQDHGLAAAAEIAGIGDVALQVLDEVDVVFLGVVLLDQHGILLAVPRPGPVLVRPAQAEREVDLGVGDDVFERLLHELLAVEPVVVEAERRDAVGFRQCGLLLHGLHVREVVVADVAMRRARLVMAREPRHGLPRVGPFGEAFAPPFVVLGERVELRQVERDDLHVLFLGQQELLIVLVAGLVGGGLLQDLFGLVGRVGAQAEQFRGLRGAVHEVVERHGHGVTGAVAAAGGRDAVEVGLGLLDDLAVERGEAVEEVDEASDPPGLGVVDLPQLSLVVFDLPAQGFEFARHAAAFARDLLVFLFQLVQLHLELDEVVLDAAAVVLEFLRHLGQERGEALRIVGRLHGIRQDGLEIDVNEFVFALFQVHDSISRQSIADIGSPTRAPWSG